MPRVPAGAGPGVKVSADPTPMTDAEEAALLARQRDEVLRRCAAREAKDCTYIRIADVYDALITDPADEGDGRG
jgi:hypothetical protein